MSNYHQKAKNPKTGKFEMAEFLDDYYTAREYGVRFPDGSVYRESEVEVYTANATPPESGSEADTPHTTVEEVKSQLLKEVKDAQQDNIPHADNFEFPNFMTAFEKAIDTLIETVATSQREQGRREAEKEMANAECLHEWVPCSGRICTSDLHTHHCSKCGKHKQIMSFAPKP